MASSNLSIGERKKIVATNFLAAFNDKDGVPRPRTWSQLKKNMPKSTLSRKLRESIRKGEVTPLLQVDENGQTEIIYLPPKMLHVELRRHLAYLRRGGRRKDGRVEVQQGEVVKGKSGPYFRRLKGRGDKVDSFSEGVLKLLEDQDKSSVMPGVVSISGDAFYLNMQNQESRRVSIAPFSRSDKLTFVPSIFIYLKDQNFEHLSRMAEKTGKTAGEILDNLIEKHL